MAVEGEPRIIDPDTRTAEVLGRVVELETEIEQEPMTDGGQRFFKNNKLLALSQQEVEGRSYITGNNRARAEQSLTRGWFKMANRALCDVD